MSNLETAVGSRIGSLIRKARLKQNLSQTSLADGICSQPMISSIEKGSYIPNAAMFIDLCNRLGISIDKAFLNDKIDFGTHSKFASHIFKLCKKHQYAKMIEYMDDDAIFNSLESDEDFQIYYYYYGCGLYQLTKNPIMARRYLRMAATFTLDKSLENPKTEVELLVVNALGVIACKLGDREKALHLFNIANVALLTLKSKKENLNVINFQHGVCLYNFGKYDQALEILLQGYDRVRSIESYFMLPDYAMYIMKCYDKLGIVDRAKEYKTYYDAYKELS